MYLLMLVLEIFDEMTTVREGYFNWLQIVSTGSYEAIFSETSSMVKIVNETYQDVLKCLSCGGKLIVEEATAFQFLANEEIVCKRCETLQEFPLFWLTSQVHLREIDASGIKPQNFSETRDDESTNGNTGAPISGPSI